MNISILSGAPNEVVWFVTDPHEPVKYEVHMHPPTQGNWSLKGLAAQSSVDVAHYKERLGKVLSNQGLRTVFAPDVVHMSGLVLDESWFTDITDLPYGIRLRRPTAPCDGVPIPRHHGAIITFGGCVLIVLTFRSRNGNPICLVAHAGLKSLADEELVHKNQPSRRHSSIVEALVEHGKALGGDPDRMVLRTFGSVPWQAFRYSNDDQVFGEKNFVLLSWLQSRYGSEFVNLSEDFHEHICLNTLIETQAKLLGVGTIHAHGRGLPLNGPFPYVTHGDPNLSGAMRYLATVMHL